MKELFTMWRNTRMIVLTAICAAVYVAVLIPFAFFVIIPGFTDFRPAVVVLTVCSVLFGPAAAWGAGIGNTIGDYLCGRFGLGTLFGFMGNFLLGYVPYKLFSMVGGYEPGNLNWRNAARFVSVMFVTCSGCSAMIGWGLRLLGYDPKFAIADIAFANNFILNCILGPVVLGLTYHRVKKMGLLYTNILGNPAEGFSLRGMFGTALMTVGAVGGMLVGNLFWISQIIPACPAPDIAWGLAPFIACMLLAILLL